MPSYNNYPQVFPRNVSPFPPFGTSNLPSYLYPQENVLNENAILNQGNDNIVEIDDDDDDDAVDQPEKGHLRAGALIYPVKYWKPLSIISICECCFSLF
ncbi:hypothetical protein DY000_02011239 [Brassica cretica]|uniref:Uncharacterized protein n=1 Tax=Brassica cretica TaxID=69181 RepID=A0ABQ7CNV0_BRACR|nr:hypothetical protein DY000_02011239 [Brassica cretica]